MKTIKTFKYKDKLKGGLADNYTPDDFDKNELEIGKTVELEHTNNPDVATEIAMDHMIESKDLKNNNGGKYYDKLEDMEKKIQQELNNKKSAQNINTTINDIEVKVKNIISYVNTLKQKIQTTEPLSDEENKIMNTILQANKIISELQDQIQQKTKTYNNTLIAKSNNAYFKLL